MGEESARTMEAVDMSGETCLAGQEGFDLSTEPQALEEVRVSVRRLVEFILRHGDIDNRRHISPDNAMQEGGRVHRMIQRRMGAEYQAEVPLKMTFPADGYMLSGT